MPRSGRVEKKQIAPDPIYQSTLVAKLINKLMVSGKKALAERVVYGALEHLKSQGKDPIKTLEMAVENITPRMEVRPRRVGGASYMVPMEVRGTRRLSLAISWLVNSARSRKVAEIAEKPKNKPLIIAKLTNEIREASENTGKAVAKKEEMHRIAEANKAFAHFRW